MPILNIIAHSDFFPSFFPLQSYILKLFFLYQALLKSIGQIDILYEKGIDKHLRLW
jgi:hypothetical protein